MATDPSTTSYPQVFCDYTDNGNEGKVLRDAICASLVVSQRKNKRKHD